MWVIFSLLAALSAGISITLTKSGLKKVDPILAFAIESVLILLISWSAVFLQHKSASLAVIDKRSWTFLLGAGVATCLSSLLQFTALKAGEASVVSSLTQLSLFFSIFFAVIFLKEELNWKLILGAACMICGAVLIALSRKSS